MRSDISLQNACRSLALLSPGYSYFPIANSCRLPLSATDDWNLASFRQVHNLNKNVDVYAILTLHANATLNFELKVSDLDRNFCCDRRPPAAAPSTGAATPLGMGHSGEILVGAAMPLRGLTGSEVRRLAPSHYHSSG